MDDQKERKKLTTPTTIAVLGAQHNVLPVLVMYNVFLLATEYRLDA